MKETKWSETVILVDADYADGVAFNLTVNFERMLNRRIPRADLARWLVCMALDGGVRPGKNDIQVVFVHGRDKAAFDNFTPSDFAAELDGKAFEDKMIGEFKMCSVHAGGMEETGAFYMQSLEVLLAAKDVKRLIVVADMDSNGSQVRNALRKADDKDVTLLAMAPVPGGNFKQDILGYSLMNALGISADEMK